MSVDELETLIFKSTADSTLIAKSVQELPVVKIIPLLQSAEQLLREEKDPQQLIKWINEMLTTHSAYLSSIGDLDQKLCFLVEWMQKRSRNLGKILQLHGRVDLMGQQMELRADPIKFAREEPLIQIDS